MGNDSASDPYGIEEGLVAAATRTIFDLVTLLVDVGMSDEEVLDTVNLVAHRVLLEKRHGPAN